MEGEKALADGVGGSLQGREIHNTSHLIERGEVESGEGKNICRAQIEEERQVDDG